jgi:ABC-2 type transport system ATP-binding protein
MPLPRFFVCRRSSAQFLIVEHGRATAIDFHSRVQKNVVVSTPAIEIDALTKDYAYGFWRKRQRRALDSLTLEVREGEVFGFLGPNGAGKTTTLKLLMSLIFPTSGSARIRGRSIDDIEMHREIGFLPEQPYFYDYLTARELLDYSARFFKFTATDRRERVTKFLERVGLSAAADVQLRRFSKGMLQRVGIAQAILHDPQVIFLDEPTSGLDPVGRREVREIILDLQRQGRTVFFSTHILPDAEVLCDRVAVLVGGKLQGVGTPQEIVSIEVQGMEVLFELPAGRTVPTALASHVTPSGGAYRLDVPEAQLYDAIGQLRACDARILSVTQLKPTLEDYFFKLVGREAAPSYAVEVAHK